MPRVKQRTPELRAHVLQVALDVLAADGIAAFTTRRVAEIADTSTPAVYELFGDKAGLVREMFSEGFRLLSTSLASLRETADPRADLSAAIYAIRSFALAHPVLGEVMFSRPFSDFDPGPEELAAGETVRELLIRRVRRCLPGVNAPDAAHVLLATAQGLAIQETAGWLGRSRASADRRWALGVRALLDGLARD